MAFLASATDCLVDGYLDAYGGGRLQMIAAASLLLDLSQMV